MFSHPLYLFLILMLELEQPALLAAVMPANHSYFKRGVMISKNTGLDGKESKVHKDSARQGCPTP